MVASVLKLVISATEIKCILYKLYVVYTFIHKHMYNNKPPVFFRFLMESFTSYSLVYEYDFSELIWKSRYDGCPRHDTIQHKTST